VPKSVTLSFQMAESKRSKQQEWGSPLNDPAEDDVLLPTPRLQLDQVQMFGRGPVRVGFAVEAGGWVAYGGRYVLPRAFTAMWDVEDSPKLFLRIVVDDQGRAEVDEVNVLRRHGSPPISSTALRDFPLAKIVRLAMEEAAFELVDEGGRPSVRRVKERPGAGDDLFAAYQQETRAPARQGVPVTDSRLREVAELYRDAAKTQGKPKQVIAQQFHVSTSTASRWIRTARERGLLGEAMPGRAGEFQSKEENNG
jgi:hypothetical protein